MKQEFTWMPPIAGNVMTSCLDSELLSAIAQNRDAQAFTEFFNRYQKQAYNLAYHLTRKPDLAEEALQECMLRIWTGSATFRSEGSARSWMLRIVANKCFGLHLEMGSDTPGEGGLSSTHSTEEDVVKGEATEALQNAIQKLEHKDRCMIAMYYTGEMSQEQIAQKLSMPTRTVSYRIQKALDVLRTSMSGAGFAAGSVALADKSIGEAFCQGPGLPPKIAARILEQTLHSSPSPANAAGHRNPSQRERGSPSLGKQLWTMGLAACMALTVAFGVWSFRKPSTTQPARPAQKPTDLLSHSVQDTDSQGFHDTWTFEGGVPKELTPHIHYPWKWVPAEKNLRPGIVPVKDQTTVFLPERIYPRPFQLTLTVRHLDFKNWAVRLTFWHQGKIFLPLKCWRRFYEREWRDSPREVEQRVSFVFTGKHLFEVIDDRIVVVEEYPDPMPRSKISLSFENWRVEGIEIKSVRPEDLPSIYKTTQESISKFGLRRSTLGASKGGKIEWMEE